MTRIIFAASVLALVISALFIIVSRSKLAGSTWKQATSQNYNFTVSYPGTWQQSEDEQFFSLVDTKDKTGGFKTYIRFGEPEGIKTKEDFDKIYQLGEDADISKFFPGVELTKRTVLKNRNLTVGGRNGFSVYEESIMPGPYYSDGVYLLREDKVYYVHLTSATKDELEREKPIFESVLSTFQFR